MIDFETEWQKMLAGEIYHAGHSGFARRLEATREKIYDFNNMRPSQTTEQQQILRSLLGSCGENIHVGENFFANFNLTILDEGRVTIGDNVFIGPNVSIYTACHPLEAEHRNTFDEWAEPVTIGNNVWIGGSVTILPGVTIGDNAVIGAGSVVTRSVPPSVVAAGNPARVIKSL